jgi:hypothetical protein
MTEPARVMREVREDGGTAADIVSAHLGAAQSILVLSDEGPRTAVGWTIGRGRADGRDGARLSRNVGIDIVLTTESWFVISERLATEDNDGAAQLDAHCATFATAAEVRAHCEATTFDPMWDAARRAALDDAARHWPSLTRGKPGRSREPVVLPFSLD